ncbi:MAG: phosphomannomutase/phosphoglucomutase [Patescibacteria group bacterium]
MNPGIFKAYDIRGIYPDEINEDDAYAIGRAVVTHLKPKRLGVGRDIRSSSPSLFASFARGVMDSGCDVLDLGVITTPMVYFAAGRLDIDAAISLTASHNPPQYNGMKIALRGAVPVGEHSGLSEIRDLALQGVWRDGGQKGTMTAEDIKPAYYGYFTSFADFRDKRFTLVIDTANAMGVLELPIYEQFPDNLSIINLYDDLEHPFECHEANPLKLDTLDELREKVRESHADLGIAYDGDADRIGFVDETGAIIPMDLVTALLAKIILQKRPGATILYDLRSSRAVKEIIEENGGIAHECKVGHANIKKQMREDNAIFAGELSGHYYFEENSFAEAGTLPALLLLNLMAETGASISQLVKETRRYYHSGEINSEVADPPTRLAEDSTKRAGEAGKDAVLAKLRETYADGRQHELDGLKVDYPDWWFNVRASNTEPLLRLNLEANTLALMEEKKTELLTLIRQGNM